MRRKRKERLKEQGGGADKPGTEPVLQETSSANHSEEVMEEGEISDLPKSLSVGWFLRNANLKDH